MLTAPDSVQNKRLLCAVQSVHQEQPVFEDDGVVVNVFGWSGDLGKGAQAAGRVGDIVL